MNSNLIRLTKTVTVSVWLILCAFNTHAAAPVAVDDTYSVIEGGTLTIAAPGFLANDFDPDGDTFLAQFYSPFLTGVSANVNGGFTYVHDGAEVASVFFGIIIRDAGGLDSVRAEIITINIVPVDDNTPVVIGTFNGSVTEGNVGDAVVTASNNISITDADFHQSPTFSNNQSGIYGTVDVTTTPGRWVYTLDQSKVQALGAGVTVTDAVKLVASDGTEQIISITITGSNDTPVLTVTDLDANEDGAPVNGTSNLVDPDVGDTHTYTATPAPANKGSVSINASTGAYTFDPGADFQSLAAGATDTVTFDVTVTDNNLAADTKTVTVTITGTNDIAVITATDATGDVEEDNVLSVNGSLSITDADAGQAEFIAQTGIASTYGSFSISTSGAWQFNLDNVAVQGLNSNSTPPVETFAVSSNDSSASTSVSITVNGVGDNPVLPATTIDVLENADSGAEVLNLLALTTDNDTGETFTYSILSGTSLPAEFAIDSATGILSVSDYAPGEELIDFESATAPNPYILTIQVIDSSEGRAVTAPITINIIDTNDLPGDTLCETYTGTTSNGIVKATDLESTLDRLGLFTPATPCQRVILTALDYDMDEGNLLSAVIGTDGLGNAVTVPSDVGNINYREALDANIITDQDPTSDLNFYLVSETIAATGGKLEFKKGAVLKTTGEFEYTPDAALLALQANPFIAEFIYQACDRAIADFPSGETKADRCAYGVVRIVVKPPISDGANVETNLQYNALSQGPLELPRAAAPNVFVVMDNSADQASDILTDQLEGLYQYDSSGGGVTPSGNTAPVAISDTYQVNSGTGANATITATAGIGGSGVLRNDYDAECDSLAVTQVITGSNKATQYGTLDLRPDGSFVYEHTETGNKARFSDSFSYTVSDGVLTSAIVVVDIEMIRSPGVTPTPTPSGNTCTPGGAAPVAAGGTTATHIFESIPGGTQAPTEADLPGQGLWRLRNSDFNKVYYNPAVLYEPWSGSRVNNQPFEFRKFSGTTITGFNKAYTEQSAVTLSNAPDLARYYIWNKSTAYEGVGTDGNDDDVVDIDEKGKLIEIVSGVVLPPKAITRTDCAADPCTYEEELENFANFYTYARTRLNTFKGALSSVVASAENMHVGFGGFQGQSNNVPLELMLESPFAGSKKELLDNMLSMNTPSSASAAYAALDKVGSYYEGDNSNSIISGISGSPITDSCQQNFALWVSGGVAGTAPFNPGKGVSDENIDGDLLFSVNVSSITPVPVAGAGTNIGTLTLVDSGSWSYVLDNTKFDDAYPLGLGDGQVVFDNFTVSDGVNSKTVNVAITGVFDGTDIVPTPQEGGGTVTGNTDWDGRRYGDQQPVATGNNALVSLADIAMYYYERDLSPLANEVPATARDIAGADASAFGGTALDPTMHQHMSTFVVAFGVGVPDSLGITKDAVYGQPYTAPFDWTPAVGGGVLDVATEEGRLVDLLHAAVNGRGDYLSAGNPDELKANLENAFLQFSQAIGTASAVSFNSQEVQEGTNVFRAFYNIRENTGDLVAQELDPVTGLGDIAWSAAAKLDTRFDYVTVPDATGQTDNRQILSYNSVTGLGIAFKAAEMSTTQTDVLDLGTNDTALLADHVNYLRGDASNERPIGNLRPRPPELGRMGDVISSTPVFYGAPNRERREKEPFPQLTSGDGGSYTAFQAKYTILPATSAGASPDPALIKRTGMVYVGSNDGMLHGFNANTGDEVFAYIPELLITGAYSQRLTQLLGDDYAHRFTVDLTAGVNDIYMDLDPADTSGPEWLTMLIGGYRAGAKGYFALDITDPTGSVESTKAITEATAADRVLWEFDDTDDSAAVDAGPDAAGSLVGYPRTTILAGGTQVVSDLGYTYSQPTIAISNVVLDDTSDATTKRDGNRWLAAFGNGYESTSGNAALYIMFPDGGTDGDWCNPAKSAADPLLCADLTENDFVKIVLEGRSSTGVPNGLSQPRVIDTDGNGTADIIYAGDRFGNLYRTDISSADPTDWSKPANTVLLFSATHSYQDTTLGISVVDQPQPITTQPIVLPHPQAEGGGYMVVFTTGSYIYDGDDTFDPTVESELRQKGTESIYGIWDQSFDAITVEKEALTQRTYRALNDPVIGTPVRIFDPAETKVIDYGTADPVTSILPRGWYLDFANRAPVGDGVLSLAQTAPETPRLAQYPGEKAIRNLQTRGGIVFVNSVNPKEINSCSVEAGGAANAFCPSQGNLDCNLGAIFDTNGDGDVNEEDQSTLADGSRYTVASMFFEGSVPTDSTFIGDQRVTQLSDQTLEFTKTDTNASSKVGRISWKLLKDI
jgi:VCBS repeat-containing protein